MGVRGEGGRNFQNFRMRRVEGNIKAKSVSIIS